jgi:hypothetical protein
MGASSQLAWRTAPRHGDLTVIGDHGICARGKDPRRLADHTTGGRPSSVILTTVRHRMGCRAGRSGHPWR